jgi:hypothetical protein
MKNPEVMRLDQTAQLVRTYAFPECGLGTPRALSPDGSSFYAYCSGQGIYEVDIATGERIRTLNLAGSLAVMGEFRAAADRTQPAITIRAPLDGATYAPGQSVAADYQCTDDGGSGLATCTGTVADGLPLDTASEAQKTFTVTATDGAGNATTTTLSYRVALPAITIANTSAAEGAAAALTVTLSHPSHVTVTVRYATANGSARVGSDYVRTTGGLTFAPGQTTKTISVSTVAEALFEFDETFAVNLTSPTNATLADAQGVGTIVNDDPMPSVSIGDVSKVEGAAGTFSQLIFTVTLSAVSGVTSKVRFATANRSALAASDYAAKGGTLSIAAGKTTGTVAVTVKGDAAIEPDETFALILSAPVNVTVADGEALGTIANDD